MTPCEDKMFDNVILGSLRSNECSPKEPDPEFLGILINAPKKVIFEKKVKEKSEQVFARVPVCGFYMLPAVTLHKYLRVTESMRIIAIEKESGDVFYGRVAMPVPGMPKPQYPKLMPDQLADMSSGGYFNSNLTEYVLLPQISAVYDVHVELGEKDAEDFILSNVVTIEIVENKKEDYEYMYRKNKVSERIIPG